MPGQPNFFSYIGGKYYYAPKLIPLFPKHKCYVEVFGGAGNVLIQKPPSKVEVFNDINSDIVNLFRVLRDDYEAFIEKIENVPYSREEYYCFLEQMKTETDALHRAVMWYTIANMSFSGRFGHGWKLSIVDNRAVIHKNKRSRLYEIRDRLSSVMIENRSFEFILDTYDREDTFFYLDPPYLPETRNGTKDYKHEMSYEDHEKLFEILKGIKGKAMLSGYPSELYETLGWNTYSFEAIAHSAGRTRNSGLQGAGKVKQNQKRTEMVYMNY